MSQDGEEAKRLTDEQVANGGLLSIRAAPLRGEGYIDLAERNVERAEERGGDVVVANGRRNKRKHFLLDLHLCAELGAREARGRHDTSPVGLLRDQTINQPDWSNHDAQIPQNSMTSKFSSRQL